LATMIESKAAQKAAPENAEKSIVFPYFYYINYTGILMD